MDKRLRHLCVKCVILPDGYAWVREPLHVDLILPPLSLAADRLYYADDITPEHVAECLRVRPTWRKGKGELQVRCGYARITQIVKILMGGWFKSYLKKDPEPIFYQAGAFPQISEWDIVDCVHILKESIGNDSLHLRHQVFKNALLPRQWITDARKRKPRGWRVNTRGLDFGGYDSETQQQLNVIYQDLQTGKVYRRRPRSEPRLLHELPEPGMYGVTGHGVRYIAEPLYYNPQGLDGVHHGHLQKAIQVGIANGNLLLAVRKSYVDKDRVLFVDQLARACIPPEPTVPARPTERVKMKGEPPNEQNEATLDDRLYAWLQYKPLTSPDSHAATTSIAPTQAASS